MSATVSRGMHRVRWSADREPEMQCGLCYEYLPMTLEFWVPIHGTGRCRACWVETTRKANRARRADPEYRKAEKAAAAAQRAADRVQYRRDYNRDYHRKHYSTLARFQKEGRAA